MEKNKDKDFVIYFFKKNCDECVEFELFYTKLAKHHATNRNIIFTKMNKDNNDYPIEFEALKYPALFIRKANENIPIQFEYNSNATVGALMFQFIEENKTLPKSFITEL